MAILRVADVRTARRYMRLAGGFQLGREYRIRRHSLLRWIETREAEGSDRATGPAQPGGRVRRSQPAPADWRARINAAAR